MPKRAAPAKGGSRGRNTAAAKRKRSLNACTHPRRTKTIPLPHEEAVFAELGDEWNAFIKPRTPAERHPTNACIRADITSMRCDQYCQALLEQEAEDSKRKFEASRRLSTAREKLHTSPAAVFDELRSFAHGQQPEALPAAAEAPETAVHAVLPNEAAIGPIEMTQAACNNECYDDGSRTDDEHTQGRNDGVFPAHTGHQGPAEQDAGKAERAPPEECCPPGSAVNTSAVFRILEERIARERSPEGATNPFADGLPNETPNSPSETAQIATGSGCSRRVSGDTKTDPPGDTKTDPPPTHMTRRGYGQIRPCPCGKAA